MNHYTSTYSILGIDKVNNKIGVASASCVIGVGGRVQFYRPQIGIAITQYIDMANIANHILDKISVGTDLSIAINEVIEDYPEKESRQVAVLDFAGNFQSFTGELCAEDKSTFQIDNYLFIGNTLSSNFQNIFEKSISSIDNSKSLSERLLFLLNIFSNIGADKRGCESAGLLVVPYDISGWEVQVVNLRIDFSQTPVSDLINLYNDWSNRFGLQ